LHVQQHSVSGLLPRRMTIGAHSGRAAIEAQRAAARDAPWRRRLHFFLATLRARPSFALGYAIVGGVILIALLAPWIAPFDPMKADPTVSLQPPSARHLLGTDGAGMDILSRVLYAPRVDLAIAVIGTFVSAVVGGAIGAVVGYYEGQRTWRRALST